MNSAIFSLSKRAGVCPSSWVSWCCYGFGLLLALTPETMADLAQGGASATILGAGILVFFVSASLIQRHMRLSLLSSSYGQPKTLTTDGVFGVSRNPIYCAFLMPLMSLAFFSVVAAVAAIVVYVLTMTVFIIRHEEDCLRATFGAAYEAYAARTPRWLMF